MEEYPFIEEFEGQEFLETDDGSYVALVGIFEMYSDPELDASDVAEIHDISEKDVRNAVFYWTEEEGVYERLVEESGEYPEADLPVTAESDDRSNNLDRQQVEPMNPLHAAGNAFKILRDDPETDICEEDILDAPDESYIGDEMVEAHIEWERNDSNLAIYAGWNGDLGLETGFVSYAVDGEKGPTLEVDLTEMESMVYEMHTNAVMGSLD